MDQVNDWDVGLRLREQMKYNDGFNLEDNMNEDPPMDTFIASKPLHISLEKPNWSFLAGSLLKEYKRLVDLVIIEDDEGRRSTAGRLIDTPFTNQSLFINVRVEEKTPTPEPMDIELASSNPVLEPEPEKENNMEDPPITHENTNPVVENSFDVSVIEERLVNSQKRKREDQEVESEEGVLVNNDNDGNSENDEESEAEEKRLSLR